MSARDNLEKITYTLRLDFTVDVCTSKTGPASKVSIHISLTHKIIYTRVPWLQRGRRAGRSPRNDSHMLWPPEAYTSVH